jgi:Fur family ferric uptake transcriptional regulator
MRSSKQFRATIQRTTILDAVKAGNDHPTAEQIHARIRRWLPRVSLGTVYRNLSFLNHLGLIRQVSLAGEPARYDGNVGSHDHARCVHCGRIEDVALELQQNLEALVAEETGYEVGGHRIEFVGRCPDCTKAAAR